MYALLPGRTIPASVEVSAGWNGRIETDMMSGRSLTILRPVFDFLNLLGFKIWRLVQSRWATSRTRTRTSGW